jgi:cyclic pyranopterin phosphate synthase
MGKEEETSKPLSHVDAKGDARMVDVGLKKIEKRTAVATGTICMGTATLKAIQEDQVKKGNVLAVARIAGIQAAKATPSLIPLCHPLLLDSIKIDFEYLEKGILATCQVMCQARTGVEMEALTGTSVALLTIYDMCKAIDKEMTLEAIRLVEKKKEEPTT